MSPTKFISHENRARPIGTLSWHSHRCAWRFALPPTLSRMRDGAGTRSGRRTVAAADAQSIDWAKVDGILGRTATVGGTVHRYGFPRADLTVTLDGVTIRPTLALGGWIAFQPMAN